MALLGQALPWEPTYNREIKDANNAVVQYTQANIGMICSAVNAHERMVAALDAVQAWLSAEPALRGPEPDILAVINQAIGRIGLEQLASQIESTANPSAALDRGIAVELRVPEAQYTASIDTAMTIIPAGGKWKVDMKHPNYVESESHAAESVVVYIITVTSNGRETSGTHASMPMAICIAALRAWG